MANDLLIKINADAKNAQKAFDDIRGKTEDLEKSLNNAALIAGAAFALLTAEIYLSVKAFEEAERSAVELTNALQNQGIFTEELRDSYKDYAKEVEAATGIDDDAIVSAQAKAQVYLGQTKITQELTAAIADLAALEGGDLNSAAEKIGRTIGTNTNAFRRQGLVISETATEAEKFAKVLEFVQLRAGGLAAELNKADGFTKAFQTAFGNLQEAIGARFAPVFSKVREIFVSFFNAISQNEILADLTAALIAGGAAMAGIIAVGAALVPAFLAASAAAATFGVSLNFALLGIPALIGAVVAAVVLLANNWTQALAGIQAAVTAFGAFVVESFSGLTDIITGAFQLDPDKINKGLDQLKNSLTVAKDTAIAVYREETAELRKEKEEQDKIKKAAADKEAAQKRFEASILAATNKAQLDLLKLQNENASKELIDLKSKEIEVLKALAQDKTAAEIALLQQRRQTILELEKQQAAEDAQRNVEFAQIQQEVKAQLAEEGLEFEAQIRAERLAAIKADLDTEADAERKIQEDIIQGRIKAQNQLLQDKKKFGETFAVINKALNSDEVKGAQTASQELVQLQQSKNETLKAIGKAAAVANITVATSESAMNIYRGFSTIPIVGPALGIAGAAAAVAFGGERISQVVAAADGGLITGGIQGRDSVPALLMPGELVVPRQNFDEVVGAVRGENSGSDPEVKNLLSQILEKVGPSQTNIFQGDVMNDDSFIDALIRKISDAVQYRNADIFGVTT